MKIQTLAFLVIPLVMTLTSVVGQTGPFPQNQSITLSMTVTTSTCGLNISTNSLNLGNIIAGQTTSIQSATITNPGNTQSNAVEIRGSNWQGINTNQTIPVGATYWGLNTANLGPLALTPQIFINQMNPGQSVALQLRATPPSQTIGDSYTQQVILTITC